tara:strand:- start:120 stop:626 length:507 start_codon:yes stop_codon:yes gene_type:complete
MEISNDNPYHHQNINQNLYENPELNELTRTLEEKAAYLQKHARTIMCLCMFDACFAMLGIFASPIYTIFFLCAIAGYYGAKKFKPWYLILYIILLFIRIGLYIYETIELFNNGYNGQASIMILMVLVEAYIIRYVYKFFKHLPFSENEKSFFDAYLRGNHVVVGTVDV